MAKCTICKKKISHYMKDIYTCRCNIVYCSEHLHDHNCSYDYKSEYRDFLRKEMPVVIAEKMNKI